MTQNILKFLLKRVALAVAQAADYDGTNGLIEMILNHYRSIKVPN